MGKHFQEHHFGLIHSWKEMVNGNVLDQEVAAPLKSFDLQIGLCYKKPTQ